MEIADELNAMNNGFRRVDLLVTMDSSGFNNDIVPQNVKKNLNIISDSVSPFSDGPNIARNTKYTQVINELRSDNIFNSKDVQFKLFESLNDVLGDNSIQNHLANNSIHNLNILRESSVPPTPNGIYNIPKLMVKGEKAGTYNVERRENIVIYPLVVVEESLVIFFES